MEHRRNNEWERDSEIYTADQLEAVLDYCGIHVESYNANGFSAFCPFHPNTDSPAFGMNADTGRWACFNPSCDSSGDVNDLLRRLKGLNPFESTRLLIKFKNQATPSTSQRLNSIRSKAPEFVEFPAEPVERMKMDFWEYVRPMGYMINERGFKEDTLRHFDVGYSKKKDMITVPMHDPTGMLVGFVGRSIDDKVFKNTYGLPKSKTAWNFHRAKKTGDTVIIVESSFDAMRIHQSGYPNVIALLGGHVTQHHLEQINKTFSHVIIMTDFDKKMYRPNCKVCNYSECNGHRPGRELGWSIVNGLHNKKVSWAAYDDTCVYPHGAKDAGDMTDDEIRHVLTHAVSHFEYSRWGIEDMQVVASSS